MTTSEASGELSLPRDERTDRLPFTKSAAAVAANYAHVTMIPQKDLKNVLVGVETALDALSKNDGKLNALEISLKSMLMVVRAHVETELARQDFATIQDVVVGADSRTLA